MGVRAGTGVAVGVTADRAVGAGVAAWVTGGLGVAVACCAGGADAPQATSSTEAKAIKLATQLAHWECVRFLVVMASCFMSRI